MTDTSPRQAMVQSALDRLPHDAQTRIFHLIRRNGVRVFLNPNTGAFNSFAGNAEPAADIGILLNADDIPGSSEAT